MTRAPSHVGCMCLCASAARPPRLQGALPGRLDEAEGRPTAPNGSSAGPRCFASRDVITSPPRGVPRPPPRHRPPTARLPTQVHPRARQRGGEVREQGKQGAAARRTCGDRRRPTMSKQEGKVFIGGLSWETTGAHDAEPPPPSAVPSQPAQPAAALPPRHMLRRAPSSPRSATCTPPCSLPHADEKLRRYFENFGTVQEAFVSYDRNTGRPRGFGFVVFADPIIADRVTQQQHTIDRREASGEREWGLR